MPKAETCSVCGQEVRRGWRHGREAWWHREDVDHNPLFGRISTPEDRAKVEAERHKIRERWVPTETGWPLLFEIETYTVAEWEAERMKKRAAITPGEEEVVATPADPIEVRATPLPLKGSMVVETPHGDREVAVPGGVRTLINGASRAGWEVVSLTYARGPYLGAKGESLGVADSVRLILRGPLDGPKVWAVGWWRNGKSDTVWLIENGQVERIGAKALTARMKEDVRG